MYGNFGYSRTGSQPVIDLIATRFPNTLDLTIWAIVPVLPVGIWLGVQAAVHQNGMIDQAARIFSIVGTSLPDLCLRPADVDAVLCELAYVPARPGLRLG